MSWQERHNAELRAERGTWGFFEFGAGETSEYVNYIMFDPDDYDSIEFLRELNHTFKWVVFD